MGNTIYKRASIYCSRVRLVRASNNTKRVMATTNTKETAARVGLAAKSMSSHICLGNVVLSPPLTKIAIVSSSNDTRKAKRKEAIKDGLSKGSNIVEIGRAHV